MILMGSIRNFPTRSGPGCVVAVIFGRVQLFLEVKRPCNIAYSVRLAGAADRCAERTTVKVYW